MADAASPSDRIDPQDAAGAETLEIMRAAARYNAWQYARIAPFLGRRILEVGSGIGNMSRHLVSERRDLAVLTDTDRYYRERLVREFAGRPEVTVRNLTLPIEGDGAELRDLHLDTVIALNVIEHIADDVGSLRSIHGILAPGGGAVVLVPAHPRLYGSLDRELGHARRYTRRTLGALLERTGFEAERLFYFNLLGLAGWWLNARVMGARRISRLQLGIFDRLVPLLAVEDRFRLPCGQSIIGIGRAR